jgi:hypothetical protein
MSWFSEIRTLPKRQLEDTRRINELRGSVKRVQQRVEEAIAEATVRGDEEEAHRLSAGKHLETSWEEDEILGLQDHRLMRWASLLLIQIPHSELNHDAHPYFTMLTGEGRSRVEKAVLQRVIAIAISAGSILFALLRWMRSQA